MTEEGSIVPDTVVASLLQAILDNTTDNIVLIDKDHKIILSNSLMKTTLNAYFGKEPQTGDDYRDFVIADNMELYLSSFRKAILGTTTLLENETKADGFSIWFQYKVNPVYDSKAQLIGVALTATNIDERKKKEIALEESKLKLARALEQKDSSERYYRKLIETSTEAVVLLDATGKVLYQTPSTEKIIGYTLADMQTLEGIELIHPDDRDEDDKIFVQLISEPGAIIKRRHRVRHKDGHFVWLETVYRNLLDDEDVRAVVLNYSDITGKVLSKQKIEKTNRELVLLNKINDLILEIDEESNLLSEVCKCIVETGDYKLAWVGYYPAGGNAALSVTPVAAYGVTDYLSNINISLSDTELSQGPTAQVLMTGKIVITNNVSDFTYFKPWLQQAQKFGIAASAVLPLVFMDNKVVAALNIYADKAEAFDEDEVSVLSRLAKNLSIAIRSIRINGEKLKAQHQLNERVKELSTIYKVNEIMLDENQPLDEVFDKVVNLLPAGWQYPDICVARAVFAGREYFSRNYKTPLFTQSASIATQDGRTGLIEVSYTENAAPEFEGPFLMEERKLINGIVELMEVYFNKKHSQDSLARSEAKFRGAFENAAIGVALVSLEGRLIMVNKGLCEITGYSERELLDLTFQQITHPDDLANDQVYLYKMRNGVLQHYRIEKRYIHKDGSIVWIKLNVAIVKDDNNNPSYFVSVIENITDKKRSETALIQSEANIRSIFESTEVGYLLLDKGYNVLSFNKSFFSGFLKETGLSLKVNENYFSQVPENRRERVRNIFDRVIADQKAFEYELKFDYFENSAYYLVDVVPVIAGSETIGICLSAKEITNRKKLELERQKMIDDLIQRNSDLQQFAQVISHNVRGPVATLLGISAMFTENLPEEERKLFLDGIRTSAEKLDMVISDLNQILQLKRELPELKVPVQLDKLLKEVTTGISLAIRNSRTNIQSDFTRANELVSVRSYLYSVFYNLLTNSIKYSRPGIAPQIKIWSEKKDDKIIICFQDNGSGIDLDRLKDKIFSLYQRFNLEVEGTGVGLFMTKRQVEILNGKIEVESKLGEGTLFRLIFPA